LEVTVALLPPFFLDAVVAVGFRSKGKPDWAATAFLYGIPFGDRQYRVFLVTNRHVLDDEPVAVLRFNRGADKTAKSFDLPLVDHNGQRTWYAHSDPDVDLAVSRINVRQLAEFGIRFTCFQSDTDALTRRQGIERGLAEGDGIFILGFPMGEVGEKRNFVIVRQGAIARIRDMLSGHSKEFLVDCNIFPGNSGGPVVLRPEIVSVTKAAPGAQLIGVVASYLPYQDVAISAQTHLPRVIFQENSGLASVFPMDYIDEIIATIPGTPVDVADSVFLPVRQAE
jgi:S1-C subfamily serine protease